MTYATLKIVVSVDWDTVTFPSRITSTRTACGSRLIACHNPRPERREAVGALAERPLALPPLPRPVGDVIEDRSPRRV